MKSIEEIYQEMLASFAARGGVEPAEAGDLALRLYAVAAQIHSLLLQADWTRRQCFPHTAEGEHLDLHAQMRALQRRAPTKAEGVLCFSVNRAAEQDLTIPAGTICMTAGMVRFETVEAGTLRAGTLSVHVPTRAWEPGTAGNVPAGTVTIMTVAPIGVAACTNPDAFSGGVDAEDDESLRKRILDSYKRLPNGANAAFYQQGALSFEQVAAATVLPRQRGIGTVDVVVASHSGIPDEELLEQIRDYFEQRREIAVDVGVLAPTTEPVTVSVAIAAADGYEPTTVTAAVEQALRGYFDGRLLSRGLLRAQLGHVIFGIEGVENYQVLAPAHDIAPVQGELPVLGELAVNTL